MLTRGRARRTNMFPCPSPHCCAPISGCQDDIPLAVLKAQAEARAAKKKAAAPAKAATPAKAAKKAKKKATPSAKASASAKAKKSASKKSASKASSGSAKRKRAAPASGKSTPKKKAAGGASSAEREYVPAAITSKQELVERILVRWWYAMTWPSVFAPPPQPADEFLEMGGIRGVYVGVHGGSIGKVVDTRDKRGCPCFKSLVKKNATALQKTLIKALKEQAKQLEAAEGAGSSFLRALKKELAYAEKLKPEKLEKKYAKES